MLGIIPAPGGFCYAVRPRHPAAMSFSKKSINGSELDKIPEFEPFIVDDAASVKK